MGQVLTADKIGKLIKSTSAIAVLNVHQVGKNIITIGGQQYIGNALSLNTATLGFGGIDSGSIAASTFYYVYAVVQGGVLGLVFSTSISAPTGFYSYRKVGAFYTDGSSNIFRAYYFGEVNQTVLSAECDGSSAISNLQPAGCATYSHLGTGRDQYTFVPTVAFISVVPNAVACPVGASQGQHDYIESTSSTTVICRGSDATPNISNHQHKVVVHKVGIDAVQPDWSL